VSEENIGLQDQKRWKKRIDGTASIDIQGDELSMTMGPSEALYYSNAELSDGEFETLPWSFPTMEATASIQEHFGSAGLGFWNHSMLLGGANPVWFVYLRAAGKYPLAGLYAQAGVYFAPVATDAGIGHWATAALTRVIGRRLGAILLTGKPSMRGLNVEEEHRYSIHLRRGHAEFHVDEQLAASLPLEKKTRFRADLWTDNAVFTASRNDPGGVYRHATQENQTTSTMRVKDLVLHEGKGQERYAY